MVLRNRLSYTGWIVAAIVAGLATRRFAEQLPGPIAVYGGDILWALTLFLSIGWLRPALRTRRVAALAVVIALAVELSQLYQAPWIEACQNTWPLGLLLGYGFLWSDLVCYLIGIGTGVGLERALGLPHPEVGD